MKFLKIFTIVILIFAATVGGAALKVFEILDITRRPIDNPEVVSAASDGQQVSMDLPLPEERLKTDPLLGTTNILLVGLDELDGAKRSDAIALLFFNPQEETVGLLSIPRDSRVQIQGHGWDKINHAYVFGGLDLLKQTIANLTNVSINYHVVLNYESFSRMIDLIGGIDLYVEKSMRYSDYSQKLFINIPQGQQHLDGAKALQYVRFRHDPLGDVGRVQRQQNFISAVLAKVKTPSIILQIPSLVREMVSAINTDLTPLEAIRLATYASTLNQGNIKFAMAPGKAAYIGSISYWVINPVELSVLIPKLIIGEDDTGQTLAADPPPPDLSNETTIGLISQIGKIGILNGDGTSGLARRASQIFQNIGVDVSYTGDARHFGYETSNIVYPSEQNKQAADALAQLCGITNRALIRRDASAQMVSIILGHDKEAVFNRLNDSGNQALN